MFKLDRGPCAAAALSFFTIRLSPVSGAFGWRQTSQETKSKSEELDA